MRSVVSADHRYDNDLPPGITDWTPQNSWAGGQTQTRTFVYNGADLASATNPENGTVGYQYDTNHRVTKKTDAMGQETRYWYDAYGRLTQTQHWKWNVNATPPVLVEDGNQRIDYDYDNSVPSTITNWTPQNAWGGCRR